MKMSDRKDNINEFDFMVKSILDEGREEVPAGVWEGVSAGLDKASHRKTVVLWWRRAAAGVAAAAAVTVGVIFNHGNTIAPEASEKDMIAVVAPVSETSVIEEDAVLESIRTAAPAKDMAIVKDMIAHAEPAEIVIPQEEPQEEVSVPKTAEDAIRQSESQPESGRKSETQDYYPLYWDEETDEKPDRRVSLVVSGIAGTNNTEGQKRLNPMKRPSLNPVPEKTGIEETSTKASYGIPVSFGVGIKMDLSPRWSIGAGLNYTLLSRQFYGKYTRIGTSGSIENSTSSDIRNVQQYIGIPVNAFYDIISNDRINLYAYAGGTVEKCVSDKYSLLNTSIVHKEKAPGLQLSANAGFGVEFMLGDHLGLYIDPSLRYYFDNGQPKSIRTVQPLMLGFEMGFRARL